MKDHVQVQVVDAKGRIASAQLPGEIARAMQLQAGEVLEGLIQGDASLLLKRRPAPSAPAPAAQKGDR